MNTINDRPIEQYIACSQKWIFFISVFHAIYVDNIIELSRKATELELLSTAVSVSFFGNDLTSFHWTHVYMIVPTLSWVLITTTY